MFNKIFIWIGKLSTAVKTISIVIAFCVTIWGLKIGYDKIIIDRHDNEQEIIDSKIRRDREFKELKQSFESFNSVILDTINNLSEAMRSANKKIDRLMVINNNQKEYQMKNAKSTDELLNIIKIWDTEKKNNIIGLYPIVLKQEEY